MSNKNLDYFNQKVFKVLAKELWQRYYRNGSFGKSIGKQKIKHLDTEPLERFIGINPVDWSQKKNINLNQLEEALLNSKFEMDLSEFVSTVEKPLLLKADVEADENEKFQLYCSEITNIDSIFTEKLSDSQLKNHFKNETPEGVFETVSTALKNLPDDYERLPMFSFQITGNPHYFDEGNAGGELLLQMFDVLSTKEESDDILSKTELKHQLLAKHQLLRDDHMNNVSARGLNAYREGKQNLMWKEASLADVSWNIPLKEILRVDEIHAAQGKNVLVVENAVIYSILVDYFPKLPIICSSGQIHYAVWATLRKLVESDHVLYYVGDMDPAGLVIAQNLLNVFPDNVKTIAMNLKNFKSGSSDIHVRKEQLQQLRIVKEDNIREVANEILNTNKVAYQEGFLEELIHEIKIAFNHLFLNNLS